MPTRAENDPPHSTSQRYGASEGYSTFERYSSVAAVILAAGAGSRFAGDEHKLLTHLQGKPIVSHVIDAARAAGFEEVIVVSGAIDLTELVPDDVTLLHNELWAEGQATSLQAGVVYADSRNHTAVVVGLGDSPGVTAEVWQKVASVDADLAAAMYRTGRRPPVKLTAAMWPSLPVGGDEGARSILRERSDQVRPVPCEGDPRDIDTLGDLRRWS